MTAAPTLTEVFIMIDKRLVALSLATLLACASGGVMAGPTGPTYPDSGMKSVPGTGIDKNVDGTSTGAPGTSPGTKGMDPEPAKKDGMKGQPHDSKKASDMNPDSDHDDVRKP
ncbi:hypothetical protein GIB57_00520 [Pseudomonas tremae]|uniref:Lipoprotein n=2 Tax=Pseudomonas TaxID=286 RepID=A0AAE6QJ14_9PSED|nr:hypothetical protein [Pseudomonas tremae]MCF5743006.1 hypothetical protein [Pseudomonas tremae]QGT82373.1 hypothetical protein GMO17_14910 [Pseudomonas coronafaciens pv. coronafaciens]